jgi:drug/metabolite transporter (DMT)-like permease
VGVLVAFAVTLLVANYGLQYGASRLPANVTSVVMLSEVVFATLSAIVLTDEVLTLQVGVGGAMILLAAGLSALDDKSAH